VDESICPECGARLAPGQTCDDLFGRLLAWEHLGGPKTYIHHHLLVMSWEAQHPSRFSDEARAWVRTSLRRAVCEGVTAQRLLAESRDAFQQNRRTWKVTRSGVEPVLRCWSCTVADVVDEGLEEMPHSVIRWAQATLADLDDA
jgi:hypothetical protein